MMIIYLVYLLFFFPRKSIFQKLYDLYVEECEKEPEVKVNINSLYYWALELWQKGEVQNIISEAASDLYLRG